MSILDTIFTRLRREAAPIEVADLTTTFDRVIERDLARLNEPCWDREETGKRSTSFYAFAEVLGFKYGQLSWPDLKASARKEFPHAYFERDDLPKRGYGPSPCCHLDVIEPLLKAYGVRFIQSRIEKFKEVNHVRG